MRKIIVQTFISLDGVMQAPGGPEEDETGMFRYGGWTAPYFQEADDAAGEFMTKWMESTDLLLGRKTYDIFSAYWPEHADMWPGIQEVKKYVMSGTITENSSKWQNVEFLNSVDDIKTLKQTDGPDLKVHGSSKLTQTLFQNGLADELHLMTFPIVLGKGKRLFDDASVGAAYNLSESLVTPNGVIFANYTYDGEIKTGNVG